MLQSRDINLKIFGGLGCFLAFDRTTILQRFTRALVWIHIKRKIVTTVLKEFFNCFYITKTRTKNKLFYEKNKKMYENGQKWTQNGV